MFECIDFDKHLADFVSEYMQAHQGDYRNFDAMEADMPAIYLRFLNQAAPWLDGLTPGSYFTQYEDPKDLVDWMIAYDQKGVPIPDLLLEQIENVGKPCEKRLIALIRDEEMSNELRMTAIGVLRSMESTQPKMLYIEMQVGREADDELADNALESLADMGKSVVQPMLEALPRATEAGQEAMLDVLARYPGNEKVFQLAQRMFRQNPDRRGLFAGYLGKLGDERALKDLMQAANDPALNYIDYLEIRNAIERLGGTAPERDFDGDPTFEALSGLGE
ncbi:MAG: hypothetical protein IJ229_14470 [Clostridia bacterium]|nr:hypothetical protein [Clostridia bacterium]